MIYIEKDIRKGIEELPFELVERKGIGHPDTICDAIAERASVNYCKYFIDKYGKVAHHWFDKVMLIGGSSEIEFGTGNILKPYKVIFAGKAAIRFGDDEIPLNDILFKSASEVLNEVLTGFDSKQHLEIDCQIVDYHGAGRQNSRYQPKTDSDLVSINSKTLVSNDCNLLSSYYPLSNLENLVLDIERYINGPKFKAKFQVTGWDVKVVGSREYNDYNLLINIPFIAGKVNSISSYFEYKGKIIEDLSSYIRDNHSFNVKLNVNPQDNNNKYYLTALGSVADTGDVGVVGRGNRINGLITPMRTMSIEAPAGKNPIDHTGKIYGELSRILAREVYEIVQNPVEIHIFTSKESKMNKPDHVSVQIKDWESNENDIKEIKELIKTHLDNCNIITKSFIYDSKIMW